MMQAMLTAVMPLVAAVTIPFVVLYAGVRLSRWLAGRCDPIDALIANNAATWCEDGDGKMDRMDWHKADRAGEHRWQQALRAQRKVRQTPRRQKADRVVPFGGRRRA